MTAVEFRPPPVECIPGLRYDGFRIGLMFPEGDPRASEAFGTESTEILATLEYVAERDFNKKFVWFKGERHEYGSEEHEILLKTARERFGYPQTAP